MQENVIVVGAPRSGTSLTASIFVKHGYYIGPTEQEADHNNPFGYYEAMDLVSHNVEVLKGSGFNFQLCLPRGTIYSGGVL